MLGVLGSLFLVLFLQEMGNLTREALEPNLILDADPSAKFDIFRHKIELTNFVIGLGLMGGLYAVKHQRATTKFFKSLLCISESKLSKIHYSILARGPMHVGINNEPITRLNLRQAFKSVALVGDNRSGKTIFLCHTILNDLYPWWYRFFCPTRGLFLNGSQRSTTIDGWLKNQISTTERDDPWSAVVDMLNQRRKEQRVRVFLQTVFKSRLPDLLKPQPVIIVVDQAEVLLRVYRAEFLMGFGNLVREVRDTDLLRLVMVINTENAVKALELMYGGDMFDVITAPKVSREVVVTKYGESFAKDFDDCNSCIGIALDYKYDKDRPRDMTAKEYFTKHSERYTTDSCLSVEITREEYSKAREHYQK
jgi:hypothetical protein